MDYTRLTRDEIEYELKIRELGVGLATVTEMKTALAQALKSEKEGKSICPQETTLDPEEELEMCTTKIAELKTAITKYSGSSKADSEFKRIETRLGHTLRRLGRVSALTADVCTKRTALIDEAAECGDLLQKKLLSDPVAMLAANKTLADALAKLATGETSARKKYVPARDWGVIFTGDGRGLSVSAFLERIEELCESRLRSKEDLLVEAMDLFDGPALVWYRSVRRQLGSWADLTQKLREEFLSPDYDDELLDEIKKRTQGPEETIGIYIAFMRNYMARLQTPLAESMQLSIIRKNLDPFFVDRLSLQPIESVSDLLNLGRKLEYSRQRVRKFQPPVQQKDSIEPDLAYHGRRRLPDRPGPSIAAVQEENLADVSAATSRGSRGPCWNCQGTEHTYRDCLAKRSVFCYGCGKANVLKPNCIPCRERAGKATVGRV